MNTILTLTMVAMITLSNNYYVSPMTVAYNKEYCVLDDGYDAWAMDRQDTLTEGQTVNVLMYNNNTTHTQYDDMIITYTTTHH